MGHRGIVAIVGWYYLTRTGNAGSVSSIEMAFRTFLENTFGVRPRNKEFLLAHPMMVLGVFLSFKYRHAVYLLIIGVMGLSMVGTFTHIHATLYFGHSRCTGSWTRLDYRIDRDIGMASGRKDLETMVSTSKTIVISGYYGFKIAVTKRSSNPS